MPIVTVAVGEKRPTLAAGCEKDQGGLKRFELPSNPTSSPNVGWPANVILNEPARGSVGLNPSKFVTQLNFVVGAPASPAVVLAIPKVEVPSILIFSALAGLMNCNPAKTRLLASKPVTIPESACPAGV